MTEQKQIICICCKEDTTEYLNHTLISKDKNTITVCDSCYQEICHIKFISNRRHLEVIEENGVNYYNTMYWKELGISWNDITD